MTSGEPMPKYVVEPASARPRSMHDRTNTNSRIAPPVNGAAPTSRNRLRLVNRVRR